jgi:membrane protease YdiL (CAAX protease family)
VRGDVIAPHRAAGVDIGGSLILSCSIALLLARPVLAARPMGPALLLACYGAIIVAASVPPTGADRADRPVLRPTTTVALGLAALALAVAIAGPPVPLRSTAWTPVLGVLAAVAEEALFRRLAYSRLLRFGPVVAILGSATAFALLHVPLYGVAVLPVDLGAGLLFSWQRWASGTWTVPAVTHAAANLLVVI